MVGAEGQSEDSVVLRVGRRHSCSHLGANQPFAGLMRCQSVLCARVWKKNVSLQLFGLQIAEAGGEE